MAGRFPASRFPHTSRQGLKAKAPGSIPRQKSDDNSVCYLYSTVSSRLRYDVCFAEGTQPSAG